TEAAEAEPQERRQTPAMTALETLRAHLRGVIAFPVTPFRSNLDLDLDALRHNVDWLIGHGIRTLVAAGGTGELYSLTVEEAEAVHRTAIETAAGRARSEEHTSELQSR